MKNATLAAAAIAISGAAALATVSNSSVNRYNLTEYDVGFTGTTTNQVDGTPSGLFSEFTDVSYWEGDIGGGSYADQNTTISNGVYSGTVDSASNAQGSGFDFAFHGSQSHFEVNFSVSSDSAYTLDGWVNAWGAINGEHSVGAFSLVNTDTSTVISETSTDTDFLTFDSAGVLVAGNYSIIADATSWVDRTFETGFGDATATVSFELNIVPAPGSMALLGLGGLVAIRRRR